MHGSVGPKTCLVAAGVADASGKSVQQPPLCKQAMKGPPSPVPLRSRSVEGSPGLPQRLGHPETHTTTEPAMSQGAGSSRGAGGHDCELSAAAPPSCRAKGHWQSLGLRRRGGGGLEPKSPKVCVPKIAQINISFCKFHRFPPRNPGPMSGGAFDPPPPRVTFRRVAVSLRGPGQSPVLPSACCVGSLRSVGRCGRCSCWCRSRGSVPGLCWSLRGSFDAPPPPAKRRC